MKSFGSPLRFARAEHGGGGGCGHAFAIDDDGRGDAGDLRAIGGGQVKLQAAMDNLQIVEDIFNPIDRPGGNTGDFQRFPQVAGDKRDEPLLLHKEADRFHLGGAVLGNEDGDVRIAVFHGIKHGLAVVSRGPSNGSSR